jgi:hypothetical protein
MSERGFGERASSGLQYLLAPQHLLSWIVGAIAESRIGFGPRRAHSLVSFALNRV